MGKGRTKEEKKRKIRKQKMQVTIETKIDKEIDYLEAASKYISSLRGKLLSCLMKGGKWNEVKKEFIAREGLLARQFNSLHTEVKGIIKSAEELKKINLDENKRRQKTVTAKIKQLAKKLKQEKAKKNRDNIKIRNIEFSLHHKKRKLGTLQKKWKELSNRGICLGTRKLFKKQFFLEDNNYNNHKEWLADWRKKRTNRIFFVGSKDETFGNQNCQLINNKLQIRVMPGLEDQFGSHVNIPVSFTYKQDVINEAIKKKQAMNYRFVRKEKGWYLFLTTKEIERKTTTSKQLGAIGVDLNSSHVAFAETNRHGNLVDYGKISTPIQDRSSHQVTDTLSLACKKIIQKAQQEQKPIVIEKLDFKKKKCELETKSKRYRRMISYFAYTKFASLIKSQAYRAEVEVIEVNPAFSSIIGKYKFAHFLGISIHIAASLVLARRAMKFSESFPFKAARCLPEDRHWHVWKLWKTFNKNVASNRGASVELFFSSRHIPF